MDTALRKDAMLDDVAEIIKRDMDPDLYAGFGTLPELMASKGWQTAAAVSYAAFHMMRDANGVEDPQMDYDLVYGHILLNAVPTVKAEAEILFLSSRSIKTAGEQQQQADFALEYASLFLFGVRCYTQCIQGYPMPDLNTYYSIRRDVANCHTARIPRPKP